LVLANFYAALTLLPLYVIDLGGSEFDTGLQTTLFYLTSIILRFYFGPLTDNKGRKIPLTIGAFAFCTAPLLFLVSSNVWSLTLARMYHAIGLAAFFSSGSSLVADLAPADKLGTYMGVFRLTFTLALLSGPPAALHVIGTHNYPFWFFLSFFSGLLALLLILLVKVPAWRPDGEKSSVKRFTGILTARNIRPVFFGITITSVGYGVLLTFAVLFISQVTSVANPGVYFSYLSFIGIFSTIAVGYLSDRWGRKSVVWPAVMLLGLGVLLLAFLPCLPIILLISSVAAGIGYFGGISALISWLVEITSIDNRGTVLALQESTIDLGIGIGSFVFGVLAGKVGSAMSFFIMGLTVFIPAAVFVIGDLLPRKNKSAPYR